MYLDRMAPCKPPRRGNGSGGGFCPARRTPVFCLRRLSQCSCAPTSPQASARAFHTKYIPLRRDPQLLLPGIQEESICVLRRSRIQRPNTQYAQEPPRCPSPSPSSPPPPTCRRPPPSCSQPRTRPPPPPTRPPPPTCYDHQQWPAYPPRNVRYQSFHGDGAGQNDSQAGGGSCAPQQWSGAFDCQPPEQQATGGFPASDGWCGAFDCQPPMPQEPAQRCGRQRGRGPLPVCPCPIPGEEMGCRPGAALRDVKEAVRLTARLPCQLPIARDNASPGVARALDWTPSPPSSGCCVCGTGGLPSLVQLQNRPRPISPPPLQGLRAITKVCSPSSLARGIGPICPTILPMPCNCGRRGPPPCADPGPPPAPTPQRCFEYAQQPPPPDQGYFEGCNCGCDCCSCGSFERHEESFDCQMQNGMAAQPCPWASEGECVCDVPSPPPQPCAWPAADIAPSPPPHPCGWPAGDAVPPPACTNYAQENYGCREERPLSADDEEIRVWEAQESVAVCCCDSLQSQEQESASCGPQPAWTSYQPEWGEQPCASDSASQRSEPEPITCCVSARLGGEDFSQQPCAPQPPPCYREPPVRARQPPTCVVQPQPCNRQPPPPVVQPQPCNRQPQSCARQPQPRARQPPACNQQPPPYNQQPPTCNHQPPPYNQQPPTCNHQPPPYNQQPPACNHLPPPRARQPSRCDKQPPPRSWQPLPCDPQPPPCVAQPQPRSRQPPSYDQQPKPWNSQPPPSMCQPQPSNTQPPPCNRQPPPCNRQPPPCNRQPPPCNRQPPPCNRQPPPCNTQPPPCNREPPPSKWQHSPCDRQPPPPAQQPSPYCQAPPPSQETQRPVRLRVCVRPQPRRKEGVQRTQARPPQLCHPPKQNGAPQTPCNCCCSKAATNGCFESAPPQEQEGVQPTQQSCRASPGLQAPQTPSPSPMQARAPCYCGCSNCASEGYFECAPPQEQKQGERQRCAQLYWKCFNCGWREASEDAVAAAAAAEAVAAVKPFKTCAPPAPAPTPASSPRCSFGGQGDAAPCPNASKTQEQYPPCCCYRTGHRGGVAAGAASGWRRRPCEYTAPPPRPPSPCPPPPPPPQPPQSSCLCYDSMSVPEENEERECACWC